MRTSTKKSGSPRSFAYYVSEVLSDCRVSYPRAYDKVEAAIADIYNCRDANISNIRACFHDYEGKAHPIQIVLLAIKWLFMEQDCTYWNYSGRAMLFEHLRTNELV